MTAVRKIVLTLLWVFGVALPCYAEGTVSIKMLAFNDFHGALQARFAKEAPPNGGDPVWVQTGGAAALGGHIAQVRNSHPQALLISVGDMVGASPAESSLFMDEPTITVMNRLGVDLNVVGNHEFDRGHIEQLRLFNGGCQAPSPAQPPAQRCAFSRLWEGANFPLIAANVYTKDGQALYEPAFVTERAGHKIAVIGAVLKGTPSVVRKEAVDGLSFRSEVAAVNKTAKELKKQGVKTIIAAIHEGITVDHNNPVNGCSNPRGPLLEIVKRLDPSIRLVLSGHTHRMYNCEINGRIVTSAGAYGQAVTHISLELNAESGQVESIRADNQRVYAATPDGLGFPAVTLNEEIASQVRSAVEAAAPITNRIVSALSNVYTRNQDAAGRNTLGTLIADAHLNAAKKVGAEIGLTNSGGIRADLLPGADGTIRWKDILLAQPFGNNIITMSVKGSDLIWALERGYSPRLWMKGHPPRILQFSSNVEWVFDPTAISGRRIKKVLVNGRELQSDEVIRVAMNDFLAEGGEGYFRFKTGADRVIGSDDATALAEELVRRGAKNPTPVE